MSTPFDDHDNDNLMRSYGACQRWSDLFKVSISSALFCRREQNGKTWSHWLLKRNKFLIACLTSVRVSEQKRCVAFHYGRHCHQWSPGCPGCCRRGARRAVGRTAVSGMRRLAKPSSGLVRCLLGTAGKHRQPSPLRLLSSKKHRQRETNRSHPRRVRCLVYRVG